VINTIPQLCDSEIQRFVIEKQSRCELMVLARESGVHIRELTAIARGEAMISFDTRFMLSAVWE
jgi:hypothetical protein